MPSGNNLSGNVPLRLEGMSCSLKRCDGLNPLGNETCRRKKLRVSKMSILVGRTVFRIMDGELKA